MLDDKGHGIIGYTFPLNLYYAYGIRNGFGMDFDPITGAYGIQNLDIGLMMK